MFGLGALFGQEPSAHRSHELEVGAPQVFVVPSSVDPLSWGWGLASAVGTTVKAMQHEIVKSVQATDWKAELMAFGKEAAEEGKTLRHKTAELVEHLPDIADHLPEQVQQSAPVPSHHPDVANTLHQVGGSLKEFGHTLLVGTKELIEQVRDAVETEIAVAAKDGKRAARSKNTSSAAATAAKLSAGGSRGKYSRLQAEIAAMQRDSATYCEEPADTADFAAWQTGFSVQAVQQDIDRLLGENTFMAELHSRIVPVIVEAEVFWARYFYRLHKLHVKEEARQQLTQRAKARQEEEEVAWDDDAPLLPADAAASSPVSQPAPRAPASSSGSLLPSPVAQGTSLPVSHPSITSSGVSGGKEAGPSQALPPAQPALPTSSVSLFQPSPLPTADASHMPLPVSPPQLSQPPPQPTPHLNSAQPGQPSPTLPSSPAGPPSPSLHPSCKQLPGTPPTASAPSCNEEVTGGELDCHGAEAGSNSSSHSAWSVLGSGEGSGGGVGEQEHEAGEAAARTLSSTVGRGGQAQGSGTIPPSSATISQGASPSNPLKGGQAEPALAVGHSAMVTVLPVGSSVSNAGVVEILQPPAAGVPAQGKGESRTALSVGQGAVVGAAATVAGRPPHLAPRQQDEEETAEDDAWGDWD
ncbi:hypothetical protein QJQ45_024023 [Haematococcus lacustris]|nr:hypothetical protein QJQ45_024023 [Haematococcus lacustris]